MSKSKAKKVFEVRCGGKAVILLARHEKGARSVAGEYLEQLDSTAEVRQMPDLMRNKARNSKAERRTP